MPGTALVMGVRKPAGGAITSRSVCGVNANGGSAGSELLGGVVAGFAVVRSVLSKQVGSAIPAWRRFSRRSHRAAAEGGGFRGGGKGRGEEVKNKKNEQNN